MLTTDNKLDNKIQEINNSLKLNNKITINTSKKYSNSCEHDSYLEKAKSQLTDYQTQYRTHKIGIFVPTGVEGVDQVTEMMTINSLMAQMHPISDGIVNVFPAVSMYREGIVRSFCKSSLLVQSWLKQSAVFDHLESICFWTYQTGKTLRQKNMTVMIDSPNHSVIILVTC